MLGALGRMWLGSGVWVAIVGFLVGEWTDFEWMPLRHIVFGPLGRRNVTGRGRLGFKDRAAKNIFEGDGYRTGDS